MEIERKIIKVGNGCYVVFKEDVVTCIPNVYPTLP